MRKLITRLFRRNTTRATRTNKKTAPTKFRRPLPDPKNFEGRPLIEYVRACGVPENTSRYAAESGITTAYFRLRRPRRTSGERD